MEEASWSRYLCRYCAGHGWVAKTRQPVFEGYRYKLQRFLVRLLALLWEEETGAAILGGEVVNYTRMYEAPSRMKMRRSRQDAEGGMYHSVGTDDAV